MTAKISNKQKTTLLLAAAAVILVIVIIAFSIKIGEYYRDAKRTEDLYRTLADASGDDLESPAAEGEDALPVPVSFRIQIEAAQDKNSDVVGWVKIDGTAIHYPILRGTDNVYYLRHNLLGESSSHASIMMDAQHTYDSPFIILYGHNMHDGTMFHDLMFYKDELFFKAHPVIQMETASGYAEYRIFAVMILESSSDIPPSVMPGDTRAAFLADALSRSLYQTGVPVDPDARTIMLTTCTYETRDATLAILAQQE